MSVTKEIVLEHLRDSLHNDYIMPPNEHMPDGLNDCYYFDVREMYKAVEITDILAKSGVDVLHMRAYKGGVEIPRMYGHGDLHAKVFLPAKQFETDPNDVFARLESAYEDVKKVCLRQDDFKQSGFRKEMTIRRIIEELDPDKPATATFLKNMPVQLSR